MATVSFPNSRHWSDLRLGVWLTCGLTRLRLPHEGSDFALRHGISHLNR